MILIGLTGRLGSGKDTAFKYIDAWCQEHHLSAARKALADKLKWSAARIFHPDISLEDAIEWANVRKERGHIIDKTTVAEGDTETAWNAISGRVFLQRYGTEAHRQVFGDEFWIDALLPLDGFKFHAIWNEHAGQELDVGVVTDVRFDNEAKRVRDLGGVVWEVHRPLPDQRDSHASEAGVAVDLIDKVVYNTRDLAGLEEEVKYAMFDLLKEKP